MASAQVREHTKILWPSGKVHLAQVTLAYGHFGFEHGTFIVNSSHAIGSTLVK